MKRLENIAQIKESLQKEALLLYITAPGCSVCKALKPKIKELFTKEFPKIALFEADITDIPELKGEFNIFSIPTILLFFDGKEFAREGRNVSLALFSQKVAKIYELYYS